MSRSIEELANLDNPLSKFTLDEYRAWLKLSGQKLYAEMPQIMADGDGCDPLMRCGLFNNVFDLTYLGISPITFYGQETLWPFLNALGKKDGYVIKFEQDESGVHPYANTRYGKFTMTKIPEPLTVNWNSNG